MLHTLPSLLLLLATGSALGDDGSLGQGGGRSQGQGGVRAEASAASAGQGYYSYSNSPFGQQGSQNSQNSQNSRNDYSYTDYGSTGDAAGDYVDYEYGLEEEGEEDRQDLGLVGIFGLGGLGLSLIGTMFGAAMFGALMAPVATGIFSSLSDQIAESDFELPELPFRALRHAVSASDRSASSLPAWLEAADSLYTALRDPSV